MSFILRAVLILLIFAFIVYVMKAIARLNFNLRRTAKELRAMREQSPGGAKTSARSTSMVRCAACGAFVAPQEAVQISERGKNQMYCSTACLQAHVKSA